MHIVRRVSECDKSAIKIHKKHKKPATLAIAIKNIPGFFVTLHFPRIKIVRPLNYCIGGQKYHFKSKY